MKRYMSKVKRVPQYSLTCCIVKHYNEVNVFCKKHNSICNVNQLLVRLKHPAVSKKNGGSI